MDLREQIVKTIDEFYVNCIEEFREAEVKIANDSRFRKIFQKKDYDGNIQLLHKCRKAAIELKFPTGDLPAGECAEKDMMQLCQECIRRFIKLCESYVTMQTALKGKSKGEDLPYKKYNELYHKTQENHVSMNQALKDLDMAYAEFTEDMAGPSGKGSGEYLTYDDITRGVKGS